MLSLYGQAIAVITHGNNCYSGIKQPLKGTFRGWERRNWSDSGFFIRLLFKETVLPPVLGPVIISWLKSSPKRMSIGTTVLESSKGCLPFRILISPSSEKTGSVALQWGQQLWRCSCGFGKEPSYCWKRAVGNCFLQRRNKSFKGTASAKTGKSWFRRGKGFHIKFTACVFHAFFWQGVEL